MVNSRRRKRAKVVEKVVHVVEKEGEVDHVEKEGEVDHVEKEDRITQLPSSIIPCILSFLPLKDAVRTSILSKFWTGHWLSSGVLDFDDSQVIEDQMIRHVYSPECFGRYGVIHELRRKYANWVNGILVSHRNHEESSLLDKFRIRFQLPLHESFYEEINRWLIYALSRGVKTLELDFMKKPKQVGLFFPLYRFPQELHARADISCLKSLSLLSVLVDRDTIQSILRNFRFLEHLKLCKSFVLTGFSFSGSSPALKYLEITHCKNLRYITVKDSCLRKLTLENNSRLAFVYAPNSGSRSRLEVIVLHAKYHPNEVVHEFEELNELKELTLIVDPVKKETPYRLISILSACPKLERFVLKFGSLQGRGKERRSLRIRDYSTECPALTLQCLKEFEVQGYYSNYFEDETLEFVFKLTVKAPLERVLFNPRNIRGNLPTNFCGLYNGRDEARANLLKNVIPPSIEFIVL